MKYTINNLGGELYSNPGPWPSSPSPSNHSLYPLDLRGVSRRDGSERQSTLLEYYYTSHLPHQEVQIMIFSYQLCTISDMESIARTYLQ
jgi:hypothetical protein